LGDIFDGAFRSIRSAPSVMFGLTAFVVAVATATQALPLYLTESAQGGILYGDDANTLLADGIAQIVTFLSTTVLSGMLTYAVAQGAVGKRVTISSSWRAIGGRVPRLIGLTLLIALIMVAAVSIPVALMAVGMVILGPGSGSQLAGGLGLLGLLGLGLVGLTVAIGFVAVRTLFAPAALVLEGQGAIASLKRGWQLSRGRFWRLLGIYLLAGLIVGVVSALIAAPAGVIAGFAFADNTAALVAVASLATALAQLVTLPFEAAVIALLYIDSRIRSEGLDLALMRAAEA
jgi:hypothetical protein